VDGAAVALPLAFTFQAATETQELRLLPGDSITITNDSGTGSIIAFLAFGLGVN